MKYWTAIELADGTKVPSKIARIADVVSDAIGDAGWPGLQLNRIGRADNERDVNRFEVDIELAPGVVLPTYRGCPESLNEGLERKCDDIDTIFIDVVEGVEACRDLIAPISDTLHDIRRRARIAIARWQREGLPAELLDVRLAPYDHWRGDTAPKTLILVEALGDDLRRTIQTVHVEAPASVARELEEWRTTLVERNANRIAILEHGASGTIDQVALNAIAFHHDLPEFLRRYSREARHWLPDQTAVHMRDGHVEAGTGVSSGPVDWHGDSMTFVTSDLLTQIDIDDAVGRPAMALLDHPYLSPDIIVASAEASADPNSSPDDERQFVTVTFAMPRKHFCNVTGRVWEPEEEGDASGTVIPFRRNAQ